MRQYPESQIGIAAPSFQTAASRPPQRSNLFKHNDLMLRSERRERLEAWAASDSRKSAPAEPPDALFFAVTMIGRNPAQPP
jgi:hypothetical protein